MTTSEKRKIQYRNASKKNQKQKQTAGWRRIWIPPEILEEIKLKVKDYLKGKK